MAQPVVVENDALKIQIWPHTGGKVSSIVDKADRFDLLFNYPSELPTVPQYDRPYGDSWFAGWDECFPAIAPSRYIGHPYDGIAVPDHGELWGLPTMTTPRKDGIITEWHGLRFGYKLTRSITLEGNSLVARYGLSNEAPFAFRFVWAMHALMPLTMPMELRLGCEGAFRRVTGDAAAEPQAFAWPKLAEGEDLSRPHTLPSRRRWKVFSAEPVAAPATVRYFTRGRSLRIAYDSDDGLRAYWGIWINTGGWNGQRHLAIEPTTGRFDELDRSVRDGSAGLAAASAKLTWTVTWTVEASET